MTSEEKACTFVMFAAALAAMVFVVQIITEMWCKKPPQEPRLHSEEFTAWKEEKKVYGETWQPDCDLLAEHLMIQYIKETGFSPFQGDYYCKEARKFLIEQGWNPKHIHDV